jgi:hypothetical protein
MDEVQRHSPAFVARRIAGRTFRYLRRDPFPLLFITGLFALVIAAGPDALAQGFAGASESGGDAAEQYMRAFRDRDSAELFASLSPHMQRALELRTGRAGPAAAGALFVEQERRGERIVGYKLVGRHETTQGETLYFYVAHVQHSDERRDIPFTVILGPDGKVTRIA